MTSRTIIGIALSAVGLIAPAIVIGVIFGFDETFAGRSNGTGELIAVILSLLSGFLSGLGISRLSRREHDGSRWPQIDALAHLFGAYEKDDSNTSHPSRAHA
jgi:hypothetical protein